MRVNSITAADRMRYRPRRAVMAVSSKGGGKVEFAVTDIVTGERTVLPELDAWALHRKLNTEV